MYHLIVDSDVVVGALDGLQLELNQYHALVNALLSLGSSL